MYAHKVMAKNRRNSIEYADSYWLKKEDAEAQIEALKICDEAEAIEGDDWHYWINRIEIK